MAIELTYEEQQAICMREAYVCGGSEYPALSEAYKVPYREVKALGVRENWLAERKNFNLDRLIRKRDDIIDGMLSEQGAARSRLTVLFNKGVDRLQAMDITEDAKLSEFLREMDKVVKLGDTLYGLGLTRQALSEVLNIPATASGNGSSVNINVASVLATSSAQSRAKKYLTEVIDRNDS